MKKAISLVLVILMTAGPLLAETEESFQKAKDQTLSALKELRESKQAKDGIILKERGSQYSTYKNSGLGSDYYKKTAESPYTKSKIAEGLLAVAMTAAYTIGTPEQASSSNQLKQIAADLSGSGVPEYQTMADSLLKTAACIDASDQVCATTEVDNLKAWAQSNLPVDSNYKPTNSEKAVLSPFAQFMSGFLNSAFAKIFGAGMAALSTWLAALIGGPAGVFGATLITSIFSSIVQNISNPEAMGSSVGDKTSSALITTISDMSKNSSTATPAAGSAGSSTGTVPKAPTGSIDAVNSGASNDSQLLKTK